MNVPERLDTPRLILRRTNADDAEAVFENYATDPDVTRYLSWKAHADVAETRDFLLSREVRWDAGDGFAWTILDRASGETMGMIDLRIDGHRAECGYVLAKCRWGAGLMTEALIAVRDLAFSHPDVQRFQIVCDVDNPASARVMEKAGFRHEGVLRRYIPNPDVDGLPRDCLCYSFVRTPAAVPARGEPRRPTVRVRELDEQRDLDGLGRCVVELQDAERALAPSLPAGADIREAYVTDMLATCRRYDGQVLVAVADERVVGYVSIFARAVSEEIDDGPEPFGLIGDLVVLRAYRGNGYAGLMLDEAETVARSKGVTELRIGVLARNTLATAIYASRGFRPFTMQLEKTLEPPTRP